MTSSSPLSDVERTLAQRRKRDVREVAWVIETANNTYWNGRALNSSAFVEKPENALRFARFVDAEIVRCWLLGNFMFALRSAEHVWLHNPTKEGE